MRKCQFFFRNGITSLVRTVFDQVVLEYDLGVSLSIQPGRNKNRVLTFAFTKAASA